MMKKITILLSCCFIALLSAALMSCEGETQVELPSHTPRLVVHGYVQTDSLFRIALGKTFAANVILPADDTYVTGATALLYEDGVLKETMAYNAMNKRYHTVAAKAQAGHVYKLVVSAPGFETVETTTTAPFSVSTQSVIFRRNARTNENGSVLNDIIFRFTDPAPTTDYYMAEVNRYTGYNSTFCVYSYDPVVEKYQTALEPFSVNSCINNKEVLFSDRSFNGQPKEITISVDKDYTEDAIDPQTGNINRPYLKRYAITADYFRFIKNIIAIDQGGSDPFARPVANFTNVKNGYGLFTVYSVVTDTLR